MSGDEVQPAADECPQFGEQHRAARHARLDSLEPMCVPPRMEFRVITSV